MPDLGREPRSAGTRPPVVAFRTVEIGRVRVRLLGAGLMAGMALGASATCSAAGWVPYPPGNEPWNAGQVHEDRLRGRYVRLSDATGSVKPYAGRHRHARYRILYRAVPIAWSRDRAPALADCCDVPWGLEYRLVDVREAPAPVGYRVVDHRRTATRRRTAVVKVRG